MTVIDTINLKCTCGKPLKVRAAAAGRAVKCPACGAAVRIPAAQSEETDGEPSEDASLGQPIRPGEPMAVTSPVSTSEPAVAAGPELPSPANTPESRSQSYSAGVDYGSRVKHAVTPQVPDRRSYPVLQFLAGLFRVLACLSVIAAAMFIYNTKPSMDLDQWDDNIIGGWMVESFVLGIAAVTIAGLLVMSAELIQLAVHVQDNTLAAVHAASRHRQTD